MDTTLTPRRYASQAESIPQEMLTRGLWLRVIEQAIRDYQSGLETFPTGYFFSQDFKAVCELAQVKPSYIRRML